MMMFTRMILTETYEDVGSGIRDPMLGAPVDPAHEPYRAPEPHASPRPLKRLRGARLSLTQHALAVGSMQ